MSYANDLELARALQNTESDDDTQPSMKSRTSNYKPDDLNATQNIVHPYWELVDPTPNIEILFGHFNEKFFNHKLVCVGVEWSKKMFSCAGICYYRKNRVGSSCTIRLSEPLLKLRPRKNVIETLLHEMIHAYLFVQGIREGNGGHGPNFKKFMENINRLAGTNITVYHTFHNEVHLYQTHVWRCNGICQHRKPFFGWVRRSMNRAPGPNDVWWRRHVESCSGTFEKISEPKPIRKIVKAIRENEKFTKKTPDIRKYISSTPLPNTVSVNKPVASENVQKHVRDIWNTRFSGVQQANPMPTENILHKRKRTSPTPTTSKWSAIDETISIEENPIEEIVLSSDEESDVRIVPSAKKSRILHGKDRAVEIKKEMLDDDEDEDSILLIDNDYDDNFIESTVQIADSSVIDDIFGNDTLLDNFTKTNKVMPSRATQDDEIIACILCQERMKRNSFIGHIEGCQGIVIPLRPLRASVPIPKPKKRTPTAVKNKPLTEALAVSAHAKSFVTCPGCSVLVEADLINSHLDVCVL